MLGRSETGYHIGKAGACKRASERKRHTAFFISDTSMLTDHL